MKVGEQTRPSGAGGASGAAAQTVVARFGGRGCAVCRMRTRTVWEIPRRLHGGGIYMQNKTARKQQSTPEKKAAARFESDTSQGRMKER